MNRSEFAVAMSVLQAGVGKMLSEEALEVCFKLLNDLDFRVFRATVEKVLLEHRYPTVPAIAVLRAEALAIQTHSENFPDPFEAWRTAMLLASRYGFSRKEQARDSSDPTVWRAIECIGWQVICDMPAGDHEYIGTQFRKAYEGLARKRDQALLLPPSLAKQIAEIGKMPQEITSRDEESQKKLLNLMKQEAAKKDSENACN